jgi:hypothetical protein
MTLQDLYDRLAPEFPESARKDLKTAVRVLARALDCADPPHCSLETFNRPLPSLYQLVERFLSAQGKKPHTVRNIKNYLSRLFRLAEAHQLFSLTPAPLAPRYHFRDKVPLLSVQGTPIHQNRGTHLSYAQWPPDLQNAFAAFQTWATAPVVPGRDASFKKRPATIEGYIHSCAGYFGFLHHVKHVHPVTFDHLFDLPLVTSFVHWHVNDIHKRSTITINDFLTHVLALTRQYRPLPALRADLMTLKKTLPKPDPLYRKEDAWVSLATLAEIGAAIWPRKLPQDLPQKSKIPGRFLASRAGFSLMLRLWTYIPLRSRNMREMGLENHLYKDPHGTWRLTFRGEQLKVAVKRGRPNILDLPFPEKLVPVLEDYLRIWRPILLTAASQPSKLVFLTRHGGFYNDQALMLQAKKIVYRYTGKAWHPHIIRTVWATEMIRKGLNVLDVAKMLNDRVETVMAKYTHLLDTDAAEKAYRLIDEGNGQGK